MDSSAFTGASPALVLLLLVLAGALVAAWPLLLRRRRTRDPAGNPGSTAPARGDAPPAPAAPALGQLERSLLETRVPLYRRVPRELRPELDQRIRAWLDRVEFVGCNGLEVRDDMRLVVAAQACVVALGLEREVFDQLHGVNLYPDEFWVHETDVDDATGVVTEGGRALSGQTVATDRIVLSWRDVEDAATRQDGYNVVVHEVAHYLDHVGGGRASAQGGPFDTEYEALCEAVDRGEETLLDPYGAEDRVEFLAVAAELFFEQPRRLRRQHAALYAALAAAFRLDPAAWPPPRAGMAD
jgi:Mlc titration factor MtfA (ptsG expression regulator)